jgi:hypothetical protein
MVSVTSGRITIWGNDPYTYRTGGWVDPRTGVYAEVKRTISPQVGIELRFSSLVTILTELSGSVSRNYSDILINIAINNRIRCNPVRIQIYSN